MRDLPCGCRYDTVRGATVSYCREHVRHPFPWWFDYGTGEVVRSSDGQRWRVEDVTPMHVAVKGEGAHELAAVDRWVVAQPGADR